MLVWVGIIAVIGGLVWYLCTMIGSPDFWCWSLQ
jgi:hypothetical protein